jgi:hypothetical protein
MSGLRGRLAAILILAFAPVTPAAAHVRSESHSVWEINGTAIDLVMTIPTLETRRLTPKGGTPSDAALIAYLTPRVYPTADGQACALLPPVVTLSATTEFRKYDFTFRCPTTRNLRIHAGAFFDLVKSHTHFAQVQNAGTGEFVEQILTSERQTVQVTGGEESRLRQANFLDFIKMGVMHIFTGVDHMSFLLGLVLISRRLKDLMFVVTGFTLGHSLTLALAVTGVIRPHAEYIDALVALTIALIGMENLAVQNRNPAPFALAMGGFLLVMALARLTGHGALPALLLVGAGLFSANYLMVSGKLLDAGRLRLVITLVFGLIHGFGFAASLLSEPLPVERLAELLVGFNVGVEIGQLTLVVGVSLLVVLLSKLKLSLPRPIVVDAGASLLVAVGVYWFVSRSFI